MSHCSRILNFILVLAIPLLTMIPATIIAAIPSNYYDSADDTNSTTLRNSLNDIITAGHSGVLYDTGGAGGTVPSYDALRRVDRDHGDNDYVRPIYSGDQRPIDPHSPNADGNPATGGWNREHAFPQSFFNENEPMRGDLHALFACDSDINSRRSNYAYDETTSPTYGPDVFGNTAQSGIFEPRDSMKGDAARAIFYMDIRYEGESGEPDLYISTTTGGTGGYRMAVLNTLLQWHNNDPPDAFEGRRNHRVYDEQGNANPFIDQPEWVNIIYGGSAPSVSDSNTLSVSFSDRAPLTIEQDAYNIPFLSLNLTLSSSEFDLGELDISHTGNLDDSAIESVRLYYDDDNDGTVSGGDQMLDSQVFSGGSATFTSVVPFRLEPGTSNFLITVCLKPQVTLGDTIHIRADANGLRHSTRGGSDTDPTYAEYYSGSATVLSGGVNIVMVSTRGSSSSAYEEFVVLANHSASPVSLNGWQLRARAATGTSQYTTDLSGTIPANGHFIIASDDYSISNVEGVSGDLSVSSIVGNMADDTRRALGIYSGTGINSRMIDSISWNSGPDYTGGMVEGTAFTGVISSSTTARRMVYARKRPGGSSGPYTDTDDNSNDIEVLEITTVTGNPKPPANDSNVIDTTPVELWQLY